MKGQWFILSAVAATVVFLAISILFKTYFVIDPANVAQANEEFYFNNIKEQFNNILENSDCDNMNNNLDEFKVFAEKEIGSLGYLLHIEWKNLNCNAGKADLGLLISSPRTTLCQNLDLANFMPELDLTCATV